MFHKYSSSIAFVFFLLLAAAITYPLLFHLGDRSVGLGDELVITWIMQWVIHALMNGNIASFFQANIYYPFADSLAYSDLHVVSSVIGVIPYFFIHQPIVVFNVALIVSLGLLGWSVYYLSYYLTKQYLLAIFSGVLVILSPAVLDKMTHIQILAIQWVPLAILFFLKFIDTAKQKYLFISLCFFLLQTYNSFLPGYFILFFYLISLICFFFWKRKKVWKLINWQNSALTISFVLLLLPIVLPYYHVSKAFQYTRDIRDSIHFALQPEDLLYASDHSRLAPFFNQLPFNRQSQNDEFKPGYLGLLFSVLVVLTFMYWIKQKKKDHMLTLFTVIGLTGLVTSLGPVLHLGRQTIHHPFPVPLPYLLFYYLLPGFQGFRNSARWEMLFIVCIAISIAIVLTKLLKNYSHKEQLVIMSFLFFGVIAEFEFPIHVQKVPQVNEFPPVYQWITTIPKDAAIIELPIYNWNTTPYVQHEFFREYYSTIHFRKMVNGYSGFSPQPWQDLVKTLLTDFPSQKTIKELNELPVDYVIVHKNEYDQMNKHKVIINDTLIKDGETVISFMKASNHFTLIKQFGEDYVFKVK